MNPFEKKTLFIVRGLPGSGKTSLVSLIETMMAIIWSSGTSFLSNEQKKIYHSISKGFSTHCTDDYFTDPITGKYNFDPLLLDEAHEANLTNVLESMKANLQYIFVHNTFSQSWEGQPYFTLARQYGYDIFVIETQNPFTSIHGVPEKVIDNMISRWQNSVEFNRLR